MEQEDNQAISNTPQNTEPRLDGSTEAPKSNIYKTLTFIFAILFAIASLAAVYFYFKYSEVIGRRDDNMIEEQDMSDSGTPNPLPTIVPTPLSDNYFFTDPSLKINYFPVKYRTVSEQYQEVAQTFTLPIAKTVQTLSLKASFGVGNNIYVDIYEAGNIDDFTEGKLVASGTYAATNIIKQEPFEVILNDPVQLEANIEYALVVSVKDKLTQTSVAFSENDLFSNGKMYKYSRLVGGNGEIIDSKHTWQPENTQDILYFFKGL